MRLSALVRHPRMIVRSPESPRAMRRILLLLLLLSTRCFAEHILIAAEDSWPPYSDNAGRGISYNLVSAAYALAGHDIVIDVVPYARALHYTEIGKVQACWNVTRQPSTEALFYFGEQPLLRAQASYYYPKGAARNFSGPASIPDGVRIGVIIDYEYGEAYSSHQHRFEQVSVPNQDQLIKMLLAHRIDAAIMFDEVAKYTLREMGLAEDVIERGAVNHVSDIYVAFSKQYPQHRQLAADLDRGLQALKDSGRYKELFDVNAAATAADQPPAGQP